MHEDSQCQRCFRDLKAQVRRIRHALQCYNNVTTMLQQRLEV